MTNSPMLAPSGVTEKNPPFSYTMYETFKLKKNILRKGDLVMCKCLYNRSRIY